MPFLIPLGVSLLAYFLFLQWKSYSRLKHFKGPLPAALSRLWIVSRIRADTLHTETASVCARYGSTARIGPNHLVTTDVDLWHRINMSWAKSDWYEPLSLEPLEDGNHLVSETDIARHEKLRAKLAPGYSGKAIASVEERVDEQLLRFIQLIDRKYKSNSSALRLMDFAQKIKYFTVDSISHIAFGEPFDDLGKDEDCFAYLKLVERNTPTISLFSAMPVLFHITVSFLKAVTWISPALKQKIGPKSVSRVAKPLVAKRFMSDEKGDDMLGTFIKAGLTQKETEAEAVVQLVAGSETTSTTIRSIFLYVLTQPRVYNKLRSEIDAVESKNSIISDAEARKLPYLEACIKEGLRIYPPAPTLIEKEAPPGGDHIRDKLVPGGTHLGLSLIGVCHSKETFGDDSDIFRPERWLDADDERVKKMSKAMNLVFGAGRYGCLGKPIALMEIRKTLFELLHRYDISIANPYAPISSGKGRWFLSDMWLRIEDRTAASTENYSSFSG